MFEVIGVVGSVASIIALVLPASGKMQRIVHAAYVLLIVVIASSAVIYKSQLNRINNAEKSARILVESKEMKFTTEGFNMAALAFLEKYKDLYPDSYERASELCKNNGCFLNQYANTSSSLTHAYSQINVSSALDGLLRGIAELSSE